MNRLVGSQAGTDLEGRDGSQLEPGVYLPGWVDSY